MNIRRGLLRLWIVGSIAWICIVGFDGYRAYSSLTSWEATYQAKARVIREPWEKPQTAQEMYDVLKDTDKAKELPIKKGEVVRLHLEWALVPPFVILVSGAAFGWALAGFRGTRRGNTS
jgi:hypothetical protein